MTISKQKSSDSDQKRKHQEKCQRTIDYVFGKRPFLLSDITGNSVINKHQTSVLILQQKQKNQEGAKCGTCGEKKIDQEDQLLIELKTSVNLTDIVNFQLDKEKLSSSFTHVAGDAKSDFKIPIDGTGLISNLTDKALDVESRSNYGNDATLKTTNPDEKSSKIIELHTGERKSNYSSVFSESSLQKITQINYNVPENVKKPYNITALTEIQNINDVIQKLGVLCEIDTMKPRISSDVPATKKKSGKCLTTNKTGKKYIDNYSTRDNEILQGPHPLPMNQFGELHAKVEIKLNSNDLEKKHAHKSQEIETPLSGEKTMFSLQHYHKPPSHLNFECNADKITVDVRNKLLQHLAAKVETRTNFLEFLSLGCGADKIFTEVTKTPSQTQAKIIESKTSRFDEHNHCEHKSEPEYFNTMKRQPTDGTTPESQSKTKSTKLKTGEPILDTKITRNMPFVDVIEFLMMRNQFYRSKGWPEPTNLLRSSPSYNVYPRQQRASKHFKWLLQTSVLENERQARHLCAHPFLTKQGKHFNKFTTEPESRPTLQQTESLSTDDIIMPLSVQNQHNRRYVSKNLDRFHDVDKQSVNISNEPSQLLIHEIKTKSQTPQNQAESVDLYGKYEPEQQSNNSLDFQQSDLPAIRPFKVEIKLNSNDLKKKYAHNSQEIETPLSEEKTMSSLQNYHKPPSHLNFECNADKITVDLSNKLSQHLAAKVETRINFLDSHKHQEPVDLSPGCGADKIFAEVTKTPSQTQAKIIESETSRFDEHNHCEHKSEPEYCNTMKRQTTDGTTPESQSKTKYAKPKTDEPILDTKITRNMPFVDIVEFLMMKNQFYRSKGWPEPTNLLRSSPSYNVYPRQQRASKHFKWLLQTSVLEHERQARHLYAHPFLTKQGKHFNKFTTEPEFRPTLQQTESLSTEDIIMPLSVQNQHNRRYVSGNLERFHDADKQSVIISNEPSQLLIHEMKTKSQSPQAEPADLYGEYEPEQQSNNTLDFQQSDLPAIRPFTDFKMPQNMSLSGMMQLTRMQNQYLDTKEHLESGDMTKTCTDGITPTLPKGPCRPGCYRLARICPKCQEQPPCPTKPCDFAPLRKLCDPCRSNTCPKHCDKKFVEAKDALGILTQNFRSNIPPKVVISKDCEVRPQSAAMETLKEPNNGLALTEISDTLSMKIDSLIPIPNFPFNIQSLFPKCSCINSVPKRVSSYENPKKRITDSRENLKNSSSFERSD